MEFEQDYMMRIIKEMVRALMSVLLGKKGVAYEMPPEVMVQSSEGFSQDLFAMVRLGKIDEAENLLYENLDYSDKENVKKAVAFYGYLNEFSEEFLTEHDFSREEVRQGLERIVKKSGMQGISEIFGKE